MLKIEPKYNNKVLIGNWLEERLQFTRGSKTRNSTYRMDYTPQLSHKPNVDVRLKALYRAEGVPQRLLFSHHGVAHNLVTLYNESYGWPTSGSLPTLRSWKAFNLDQLPERSDHPVKELPTNFGLKESWQACLKQQEIVLPSLTTYRASYPPHPISTLCYSHHVCMPKRFSSSQYPANNRNQDLALKAQTLQAGLQ